MYRVLEMNRDDRVKLYRVGRFFDWTILIEKSKELGESWHVLVKLFRFMFLLFSPMNQLSSVARSHGISWNYHLRVRYYERLTFCSRSLWEVLLFTWRSDFYDLYDIGLRIFNSNIVTPFQTLTLSRLDFSKVIENRVALKQIEKV